MATETQTPIEALRRAIDWGCASNHEDCKLPICTDARTALEDVEALVAAAEALNDDPNTLLELEASLAKFQTQQ